MNCSLCLNRYKKYFKCTSMIQKDLFLFSDEINTESDESDKLVLELIRILCSRG